jgi:hypothetical protein
MSGLGGVIVRYRMCPRRRGVVGSAEEGELLFKARDRVLAPLAISH